MFVFGWAENHKLWVFLLTKSSEYNRGLVRDCHFVSDVLWKAWLFMEYFSVWGHTNKNKYSLFSCIQDCQSKYHSTPVWKNVQNFIYFIWTSKQMISGNYGTISNIFCKYLPMLIHKHLYIFGIYIFGTRSTWISITEKWHNMFFWAYCDFIGANNAHQYKRNILNPVQQHLV